MACRSGWHDRLAAPICQFQRYEAGNRDREIELPENRLQIGETAGEWVDCHDIAVAGSVVSGSGYGCGAEENTAAGTPPIKRHSGHRSPPLPAVCTSPYLILDYL